MVLRLQTHDSFRKLSTSFIYSTLKKHKYIYIPSLVCFDFQKTCSPGYQTCIIRCSHKFKSQSQLIWYYNIWLKPTQSSNSHIINTTAIVTLRSEKVWNSTQFCN